MRLRCNLREIRGKRKLSDVAVAAGHNRGNLSLIENGRMVAKDRDIPALEEAYGAPFAEWYSPRTLLVLEEDEAA